MFASSDSPNPLDHHAPLEAALEPDIPIVDPHHHLWAKSISVLAGRRLGEEGLSAFDIIALNTPVYLIEQYLADISMGHNVQSSVFVQAHSAFNADLPPWLAPVGETEFVNGQAALSASGIYGPTRICAGIVGYADMIAGDRVQDLLEAHIRAGNGRFKGVRQGGQWDADRSVLGGITRDAEGYYRSDAFKEGFARLAPLGLSFDVWVLETQLADAIELARAFPGTSIILDHTGSPLGMGPYAGTRESRFPLWRSNIRELAKLPNVTIKLGGLGMPLSGFASCLAYPRHSSLQLAEQWSPYIETCIEAFGADRCMFESNFPIDRASGDFGTVWNAFKRIAAGASADEKTALFSGTARRVYRLDEPVF